MPKVVYTEAKGLVQEAGSGVSLETLPFGSIQTVSTVANNTGSLPGVYEFTNTGAPSEHAGFGKFGAEAKDLQTAFLVRAFGMH